LHSTICIRRFVDGRAAESALLAAFASYEFELSMRYPAIVTRTVLTAFRGPPILRVEMSHGAEVGNGRGAVHDNSLRHERCCVKLKCVGT
jgi:hypothetical protein